jgi:transposase
VVNREGFFMRPPKAFPPGTALRLKELLKQADSVADQRRIQAVLMRALDASPPDRIAEVTGLRVSTVRVIHSRFLREGVACLVGRPGRGGKRRTLLTPKQAEQLLERHAAAAARGEVIEAGAFRRDYQELVGHKVAASTVYRLLARSGWRKLAPRPSPPRKDSEAETALKKTSRKK